MPKTHDIVAIVGSYQKDGQDKPKYKNCGALIEKNGKLYIKLDAIPVHESESWNGWFSCFEPRQPHEVAAQNNPPQQQSSDEFGDSIPF